MTLAYLTDVEGRWDKLASFAAGNPCVSLDARGQLQLADGATFVFGGDAIDRGPDARRIVRVLLAARRAYGERVVLLAGNRDINKLRLRRELAGDPPDGAPATTDRGALLRWIFATTMGAGKAFDHRATELATERGAPPSDDAVVDSFLADIAVGGELHAYLRACQLGFRAGATLFLHGGVTRENYGAVPGATSAAADVDRWLAALNAFYAGELARYTAGHEPAELIAYQAPAPGLRENPESVIYSRPTDEVLNPELPEPDVIARLRGDGIGRVVVGHTPSGDCPAILRDGDFELVLGDNSYSRIELGSQLAFTDAETRVHAITELDDGTHVQIDYATRRAAAGGPLGLRDRATGQLVKSQLADGRYLLFRGFPKYRVEQLAATAEELASRALDVPR